jgi:hypothetical protein
MSAKLRSQKCDHLEIVIKSHGLIRLGRVIPRLKPLVLDLAEKLLSLIFLAESMDMRPRAILFHKIGVLQFDSELPGTLAMHRPVLDPRLYGRPPCESLILPPLVIEPFHTIPSGGTWNE